MKRWLKIGALVTFGIIFAAFAAYWIFEFTDADAQREQYAVYSDYLNNELLNNYHDYGSGHGLLVILDQSVAPQTSHELPGASAKMQRELMLHSLRSIKFERNFRLSVPYRLVSSDKLDERTHAPAELSPEEARENIGGYVTFSRVSFNRTGTLALFYTAHHACSLCGGANLVLMQKRDGHWKVIDDYSPWVS